MQICSVQPSSCFRVRQSQRSFSVPAPHSLCDPETDLQTLLQSLMLVVFSVFSKVEVLTFAQLYSQCMFLWFVEDSWQMCTRAEYYENLIEVASAPKKQVLTDVALETLSIVAYKQPITKLEIEKIRGVKSDHAVNRLIDYNLVYEVGRLDAPGRPALFATTEEFLRRFGVGSTKELPVPAQDKLDEFRLEAEEELKLAAGEERELSEDAGESMSII